MEKVLALKGSAQKSDPILGEIKNPEAVSQYGRLLWKRFGHDKKWTIHDLRRILATRMSDLGIAPHIVEQLLGHSLGGVMQIYNRSQYLPEKKKRCLFGLTAFGCWWTSRVTSWLWRNLRSTIRGWWYPLCSDKWLAS